MSKILRLGSKGEAVTAVQRELQSRVAPELVINGVYDHATEAAVIKFQKAVGFKGMDVDGRVGPKTMLAIFQIFDVRFSIPIAPELKKPDLLALGLPVKYPAQAAPPAVTPAQAAAAKAEEEDPKKRQINLQAGPQYSLRDGPGVQLQGGLTVRAGKPYLPDSDKHKFYHGMHFELLPQLAFGFPVQKGGIFTGSAAITIQPVTDWLVLGERWHLFTPSVGFYGQIPFNSGPVSDPGTHPRVGASVGVELFHFDIIPDKLSIGISGQEAFYYDFRSKRGFADPSVLGFIQFNPFSW